MQGLHGSGFVSTIFDFSGFNLNSCNGFSTAYYVNNAGATSTRSGATYQGIKSKRALRGLYGLNVKVIGRDAGYIGYFARIVQEGFNYRAGNGAT